MRHCAQNRRTRDRSGTYNHTGPLRARTCTNAQSRFSTRPQGAISVHYSKHLGNRYFIQTGNYLFEAKPILLFESELRNRGFQGSGRDEVSLRAHDMLRGFRFLTNSDPPPKCRVPTFHSRKSFDGQHHNRNVGSAYWKTSS